MSVIGRTPGASVTELLFYVSSLDNPTIETMKRHATEVKKTLIENGVPAKHMKVLEAVARKNGFNTWAAALVQAPSR